MDSAALRRHGKAIFKAGLDAADAERAVARQLDSRKGILTVGGEHLSIDAPGRVQVVGMGKASAAMALPFEDVLEDRLDTGLVIVKDGHTKPLKRIQVREAGHPVPDERGVEATEALLRLLQRRSRDDLVFCLISGGGSALSPAPAPGVTLAAKQEITRLLLASGATIHELNTIRKHLSRIKGGRLAQLAHPATVISLVLSDVPGNDLDAIASGPTVPDRSTFAESLDILAQRGLTESAPASVLRVLEAGMRGEISETPKTGNPVFATVRNVIVGSNRIAVEAAARKARALGYETLLPEGYSVGEARTLARRHIELARRIRAARPPSAGPLCLITGGEATVTLRGPGKGGRNQEFALAAALELREEEGIVVLSAGTDGTDGPTDAAGALADGRTVERGRGKGMEAGNYLAVNDSYHFFRTLGDLLVTGPTLTNVMDLRVVLMV